MFPKIVVIGLDGADSEYITPLLEEGKLPHLEEIIRNGAYGKLRSTVISFTQVAWSSLLTGRNPGKTGIMDVLIGIEMESGEIQHVPASLVGFNTHPFWKYLNNTGFKSIIINVPMTYPPRKIDGCLISGFDTPTTAQDYAYPADFLMSLEKSGIRYDLLERQHGRARYAPETSVNRYVEECCDIIERQTEIVTHIMANFQWDVFMTVCQMTDYINHRTKDLEAIGQVYQYADNFIGKILYTLPPETTIIIVSDHGSRPVKRRVSLLKILMNENLLTYREEVASEAMQRIIKQRLPFVKGGDTIQRLIVRMWEKLPSLAREILSRPVLKFRPALSYYYSNIDWEKTKVYTLWRKGPIYVNVKGRTSSYGLTRDGEEYEELRDSIIEILEGIVDPKTSERPFEKVIRAEDIWSGKYMDMAPDLIFCPNDNGYDIVTYLPSGELFEDPECGQAFQHNLGIHARDGILIMAGKNIKQGSNVSDARIIDVAPTILYLMDVPVPVDMDGKVLTHALNEDFVKTHAIGYQHEEEQRGEGAKVDEQVYTDEDVENIMEKLRGLGYVD